MYKLLLCLRYLRTRYIALASIVSVMLGVATMIVVNSVMAGFSTEMRVRIHGILADVVIETLSLDGYENVEKLIAIINQAAGDDIEAMTPTVEVYGMLSFQYAGEWITRPVTLIGIDPAGKAQVGPLVDNLDSYHARIVGGTTLRPPLRSKADTPGWELTDDAWKYRRDWVNRQRDFIKKWNELPNHDHQGNDALSPFDEDPFDTASQKTDGPRFAENTTKIPDFPFEQESNTNGPPVANVDGEIESPFDNNQVVNPQAETTAKFDPAGLMPCRLYIGSGLIEFPYRDRVTGEMKILRMVRPGDDVQLSTIKASRPPEGVHFNATVVDVFKSGMSEYDTNLVFCNLEYLQQARGMIDPQTKSKAITSIQIKLKDYTKSSEVVEKLRAVLPPESFSVKTWEQKQGPLLAAVEVERAILNVLLFLIIAVAGFGILAIFYMIVVEKTRDIGILKALGASAQGVMSIFLSYGLALGIVGSGVGVCLGLLFVKYINEIESFLSWVTGRKVFDETIYYFPKIPTSVDPFTVTWIAFGAMAIAVLASVLPARRAARLNPVQALRYE